MSDNDPSREETDGIAERSEGYLRALDLHDETGQILTAILVNLQRLGRSATGSGVGETVRDTQRLVETLFYSIRNFIRDSSGGPPPASAPNIRLGPALRRLTRDYSRRTRIGVELRFDSDAERVSDQHKAVLYRVVQESLTNVLRHSAARRVEIRCSRTGSSVLLEIEDDGASRQGVAPARGLQAEPRTGGPLRTGTAGRRAGTGGSGSGLRGMKERVRIVGGECTVRMVEHRGMTVRVVLPYNIS